MTLLTVRGKRRYMLRHRIIIVDIIFSLSWSESQQLQCEWYHHKQGENLTVIVSKDVEVIIIWLLIGGAGAKIVELRLLSGEVCEQSSLCCPLPHTSGRNFLPPLQITLVSCSSHTHLPVSNCTSHQAQELVCYVCKKSYSDRYSLRYHLRTHGIGRQIRCELCGKNFTKQSRLTAHIDSIHNNIRPFPCPHCDKAFKARLHLENHMLQVIQGYTKIEKFCQKNNNICEILDLVITLYSPAHGRETIYVSYLWRLFQA